MVEVVILAGGLRTRLAERDRGCTEAYGGHRRPSDPLAHHAGLRTPWVQGLLLALGYKGEVIKRFFIDHHTLNYDMTVELASGELAIDGGANEDWR